MNKNQTKSRFDRLLRSPAWKRSVNYSGRMGREGRKKRIGKVKEKRKRGKVQKSKRWRGEWTREEKGRKGGTPAPRGGRQDLDIWTGWPNWAPKRWGVKVGDFRPISLCIWETVQDRIIVTMTANMNSYGVGAPSNVIISYAFHIFVTGEVRDFNLVGRFVIARPVHRTTSHPRAD